MIFNEEFLVSASHQLALITSLPFVHTARRCYRLNALVSCKDRPSGGQTLVGWELPQTCAFRGSKSRNKVSVGEPADGSLNKSTYQPTRTCYFGEDSVTRVSNQNPFLTHCTILTVFFFLCRGRKADFLNVRNFCTTLNNGYLGSRIDEERSEMRYVMRIAGFSESSNL